MRTVSALALAVVAAVGQVGLEATASHAAGGNITTACSGTTTGTEFTLTADCDTTATLTVPDGFTVNGAGHTITGHDPGIAPEGAFHGPVVTNAGSTMNLTDLTVRGTGFAFHCDNDNPTVGVQFSDASGTMSDVKVLDITQHSDCLTVHAILIRSATSQQTVTMNNVTATDFQRTGLLVMGKATVNASNSTFGPPDLTVPNPGRLAQNTIQIGSPALAGPTSGTLTGNTIIGAGFGAPTNVSTALLLANATNVTVSHNTFGGMGTDVGIALSNSTGVTIDHNAINRTPARPGFVDDFGIGVSADDASRPTTTLVCNSFSGWKQNLDNVTQPPCITTGSTIPCATVDQPFTTTLEAFTENPNASLTWRLVSGELPPGLTLAADGTVSGTPTQTGTFPVTISVSDPVDGTTTQEFTFCVNPQRAAELALTKQVVSQGPFRVGDQVQYAYTVTNTGSVALNNVTVTDNRVAGVTCEATTLTPGQSASCTGTHTITQADVTPCKQVKERGGDHGKGRHKVMRCEVTNTAQATGTDPQGNQVTSNQATATITVKVEKKKEKEAEHCRKHHGGHSKAFGGGGCDDHGGHHRRVAQQA